MTEVDLLRENAELRAGYARMREALEECIEGPCDCDACNQARDVLAETPEQSLEAIRAECAMCGADISTCWVSGHNDNKFCRYCYYPTVEEARAKGKPGWHPHKAGEAIRARGDGGEANDA